MLTLKALAERFGLSYRGNPDTPVHGIGTLANAGTGQLAFLANGKYADQLAETKASVVVLSEADAEACPCACLVSPRVRARIELRVGTRLAQGDVIPLE